MPTLRVALDGDRAMKAVLSGMIEELPKIAREALKEWAEPKLEKARERAPEKSGKLKRSGRIKVRIRQRNATLFGEKASKIGDFSASIVFGGSDWGGPPILYAWKVHETHKTKAKFLERTINEAQATAGPEIAKAINLRKAVRK